MAWPPPCPDCLEGEYCDEYVGDCVYDYECDEYNCYDCIDCWCEYLCGPEEVCCDAYCEVGECCDDYDCDPDECEECVDHECECICDYFDEICCNGTCCDPDDCCGGEICCNSGDTCCTDSGSYCCDPTDICCEGDCCDPDECENCWDGTCKMCGGYPGMVCCGDGEYCCDTLGMCDECVDGKCEYMCNDENCESCDGNGNCFYRCGATECCWNETCVDKCDPDGGSTCTWTNPPVQDPTCTRISPEWPKCLYPGASCDWEPTSGPEKNAVCAPCDPGCTLDSTYCVVLRPTLCDEGFSLLPPFYDCRCIEKPGLYDPAYRGTRYVCP